MTPGPAHGDRARELAHGRSTDGDLQAALWRLLAVSDSEDATAFLALFDRTQHALEAGDHPCWAVWRHAFAARRHLVDEEPDAAAAEVAAAHEALDKCPPDADTALVMAFLAHVEVSSDHADAAMLLAVDACLLTEQLAAGPGAPAKALHQAHRWLSLTLSGLDLEELAVEQALRGTTVAAALPSLEDRWRLQLLSAHQHTELAQTLHRRGETARAHALSTIALGCATQARQLGWEPDDRAQDLLDVVQAWALTCSDELDDAVGPLRRVHRRVHEEGGLWLRGFTDLALGRLLARMAERAGGDRGEEAVQLLVDAAGAFVLAGDRPSSSRHCR